MNEAVPCEVEDCSCRSAHGVGVESFYVVLPDVIGVLTTAAHGAADEADPDVSVVAPPAAGPAGREDRVRVVVLEATDRTERALQPRRTGGVQGVSAAAREERVEAEGVETDGAEDRVLRLPGPLCLARPCGKLDGLHATHAAERPLQ